MNIRFGVKRFLQDFDENTTYISLGKWMYTTSYAVASSDRSSFDLGSYPFTAGPFCYGKMGKLPDTQCLGWIGRSKLFVRPENHIVVNVHGDGIRGTGVRLPTTQAHLKEWPGWLVHDDHLLLKDDLLPKDLLVSDADSLSMHDVRYSHKWNANGTLTLRYDEQLQSWLEELEARKSDWSLERNNGDQ